MEKCSFMTITAAAFYVVIWFIIAHRAYSRHTNKHIPLEPVGIKNSRMLLDDAKILQNVLQIYQTESPSLDHTSDGISVILDNRNARELSLVRDSKPLIARTKQLSLPMKKRALTTLLSSGKMKKGYDYRDTYITHRPIGVINLSPTICGDGLCTCSGKNADCSGHPDGLPYVPSLPYGIRFLNLSDNGIRFISTDYFINVSFIDILSLSHNQIHGISSEAFKSFNKLHTLYIDHNKNDIQYYILMPVLNMPTLTKLSIVGSGLPAIPQNFFDKADLPNLQILTLHDNNLREVNLSEFQSLKSLRQLGLAQNHIPRLNINSPLDSLEELYLMSNNLYSFPSTCDELNRPWFPQLKSLVLNNNHIYVIPESICLTKLENLSLAQNTFKVIPTNTFNSQKFPRLKWLFFYYNGRHIDDIAPYAFNNTSLEMITSDGNKIIFSNVNSDILANCPNIKHLSLIRNYLNNINEDRFLKLFGHLTNMEYLNIDSCDFNHLTRKMLSPLKNLTILHLSRNFLVKISDGTFNDLVNLQKLYLSYNQIPVVSSGLFSAALQQQLQKLDFSGNPFDCSCDILWFRAWLITKPELFNASRSSYQCSNNNGISLENFELDEQACLLSHSAYVVVTFMLAFVIISFTFFLTAFRYRWHLRLILYEAFRRRGDARRRRLETGDFDYDVFVAFDTEDLPFVRDNLMPQLEGDLGLRLCIHQRDFIVGKYIVDNIADCVQKSKKIMMLFSKHFAISQWCQFELSYCLRHVMDIDDELLIICFDDVCSRDLTAAMMAVLKTTTYIRWVGDNQDAVNAFWGQLRTALQEIARPVPYG